MSASRLTFPLLLLAGLLLTSVALAATTETYDLSWWTADGGGGTSSGGAYILSGTVGQPYAGPMSGGDYTLAGGFWGGGAIQYSLYLPVVVR